MATGVCGGFEEDEVPPEARSGAVWELYKEMVDEGWTVDCSGYTTSFRVTFPQVSRRSLKSRV